jgi:hypothetical protein
MKTAWADNVRLERGVRYIDELILEQEVNEQSGQGILFLSPLVLTEMLLVLSHYRLGNISLSLQALIDLQTLLLTDKGRYVPSDYRNLSWHILGICQHVVGDLHGALQSYHESLRHEEFNKIRKATEKRMLLVERQLHRNRQP